MCLCVQNSMQPPPLTIKKNEISHLLPTERIIFACENTAFWYNEHVMISRNFKLLLISIVPAAAILYTVSMKRETITEPPPIDIQQLGRLIQITMQTEDRDDELPDLIDEFKKSGDPALHTAKGTTMLHLACMNGNKRLLEFLLQQGADPNVKSKVFNQPIVCLFASPRDKAEETKQMLNLLLKHGAHIDDYGIFCNSENLDEDTYLYLLKKSWNGAVGYHAGLVPALRGWTKAFRAVIEKAPSPLPDEYKTLLHALAEGDRWGTNGAYVECARLLQDKGVSVEQEDSDGNTPVMYAAKAALETWQNGGWESRPSDMMLLLLQQHADIHRTIKKIPGYEGCSTYDLLMANTPLAEELTAAGYTFTPPPPPDFSNRDTLFLSVRRAYFRQEPTETLRPAFGQIATLLCPDTEMQQDDDYPEALCHAVCLLIRTDRAKATAAIAAMPLWQDDAFWTKGTNEASTVLECFLENKVSLSPALLHDLAVKVEAAGYSYRAADLMELMAFSDIDDAGLETYTHDSRAALQAGAWQALLRRKDLPAAKTGRVADWMETHGLQTAETEDMKRALRLTSHYGIRKGTMPAQEQELFFKDLEDLGEKETAEWYRNMAAKLQEPKYADLPKKELETYFLRIESATARFFIQHADLFALPVQEPTAETP